MGYGPITPGGKQLPITPWQGSWAQQEQARKAAGLPLPSRQVDQQWPLGYTPLGQPK